MCLSYKMASNMYTTLTIPLTSNKQSSNPYIQDSLDKSSTNLLSHSQSWQVTHFENIRFIL